MIHKSKVKSQESNEIKRVGTFDIRHSTFDSSRGFTLLLAMLAASIALVLGTSIFEISTKQVQLSAIGRDSEYAFYAADTGAECALYWDDRYSFFASTTPTTPPADNPKCDGQAITGTGYVQNPNRPHTVPQSQYSISFQFELNNDYCSKVSVLKCASDSDSLTPPVIQNGACPSPIPLNPNTVYETLVHADGFNTTCSTISTNPNALQRSVELNY